MNPSLDSLSKFGGMRIRVVHEAEGDFQHAPVSRRFPKILDPVNLLPASNVSLRRDAFAASFTRLRKGSLALR